jgi:hypothetical protein
MGDGPDTSACRQVAFEIRGRYEAFVLSAMEGAGEFGTGLLY